jgi:asparagine synthase (glutamine-hydrolysing)
LVENFGRKTTVLWLIRELFPWLVAVRRRKVCAGNVLNRGFVKEIESANDLFEPATEFGNYDRVSTTLWRDHSQTILPGLLHYGDSMSMAHSIEARQPFLDYRLVEWLFRQPTDAKIRNGETKWVLRRYLEKVGLGFIARGRKKVGYLTPEDKWLSDRDYALPRSLLTGSSSVIGEHCSPKALERLFAVHQRGAYGAGNHLYRLVSCELWARNCLQGR